MKRGRGTRAESCAYILKYIIDNKSQVKIGTTAAQRKLFFNLKKEADRLLAEYDHVDTKLLAENLDVKESEVIEMQKRLAAPDLSLDAPLDMGGGDGATHGSLIPTKGDSVEDVVATNQLAEMFGEQLYGFRETLKGRDLEIFDLRMVAEEPLTLQQIGGKYGITRERARQLETRILSKLKEYVVTNGLLDI